MKKIILLLVMVMGVISSQAKTDRLYATLAAENGATLSEGTFTWSSNPSDGGGQRLKLFSGLKGNVDLSVYKWLNVTITNKTAGGWRFVIMCNSNANTAAYTSKTLGTTLSVRVDLTTLELNDGSAEELSSVNGIYLQGQWAVGSFDIADTNVYLETDDYEAMDITTTINKESDKDTPFKWQVNEGHSLSTISNNLEKDGSGTIYGYGSNNDKDHGYFDLTGYDKVKVTLKEYNNEKDKKVRLLNGDNSSHQEITCTSDLVFVQSLTVTACVSIKASAGVSTCQKVETVDFIKEFKPASTTAFSIAASAKSAVAYDRSFTVGRKSTVCLPFALTAPEVASAGTFYELYEVADGVLKFREVTTAEAYTPYVFEALTATPFVGLSNKAVEATPAAASGYATTVGGYTFQGTLAHQSLPNGVYGYNASTGAFSKTTTDAVTIDAFRAYITTTSGARELKCTFGDDETTGIETINREPLTMNQAYNLAGQRVSEDHKGLVIRNGRKLMVR